MKAAIIIDDWKLPIFERRLKEAGYTVTKCDGPTADLITLSVITENASILATVVQASNNEAAATGKHQSSSKH